MKNERELKEPKARADVFSALPAVAGAPRSCCVCGAQLCLRKQVINLALGNVTELRCLSCLAGESGSSPEQLMGRLRGYIERRDCFRKEWVRYPSRDYCPDPDTCVIEQCFGEG